MSPSSLIFVAVVAVWAAYLVIDTSRRREYLATARSVDRFSASMRVLQRRAVRRESAEAFEASTAPMRSTSSVLLHRPPQLSRAAVEAKAAQAAAAPVTPSRSGGTSGLAARQRAASRVRRARVLATLALVFALATLAAAVAAGFGLISWIAPVVGIVLSTLLVVVLRGQALAGRRRTRTTQGAAKAQAKPAAAPAESVAVDAPAVVAEEESVDLRPAATAMPVAQEYVPFDYAREVEPSILAEEAYAQRVAARASDQDPLLGEAGWEPVPVPPPTYTLKARAERPLPPPLEVEPTPVYVDDDWADLQELTYGRASGE
ncbi:hypothetical protein [Mobilicoccus massiliensis]|uniref:hypothetical protein n=1 Tax=Mobilicoccus massiliensis TaxID=1522310 RepID=UPI00058EE8F0|nr:hypothetical protein [Mobilicoccus massiliensis]